MTSPSSSKNGFRMSVVFLLIGGFTDLSFIERSNLLVLSSFLLYYDVSLHKVVDIVVVIPTIPRSSKTDSKYSS
jgi:hypothetical protein